METEFENLLQKDLHQYLLSKNLIDSHLPECPDIENKWTEIGAAYLADGVREFNAYPTVSLGWCMFLGMAMAQFWDETGNTTVMRHNSTKACANSVVMIAWTNTSSKTYCT